MSDNPITTWLETLGDLPTDPVKRALTIALKAVEVWELALDRIECTGLSYGPQTTLRVSMQETKIATTDALFPPSSVDTQAPTERVSDERLEHLGRELRRLETVEGTSIIPSLWNPGEIYSIVEEVMRSRLMDQVVHGREEMRSAVLRYIAAEGKVLKNALARKRNAPVGPIILAQKQMVEMFEQQIGELEMHL